MVVTQYSSGFVTKIPGDFLAKVLKLWCGRFTETGRLEMQMVVCLTYTGDVLVQSPGIRLACFLEGSRLPCG